MSNHVFFYIFRIDLDKLPVLSCTDLKCTWKQSHKRTLEMYMPRPLEEHVCFTKKCKSRYEVIPSELLELKEILLNSCLQSGLSKHT